MGKSLHFGCRSDSKEWKSEIGENGTFRELQWLKLKPLKCEATKATSTSPKAPKAPKAIWNALFHVTRWNGSDSGDIGVMSVSSLDSSPKTSAAIASDAIDVSGQFGTMMKCCESKYFKMLYKFLGLSLWRLCWSEFCSETSWRFEPQKTEWPRLRPHRTWSCANTGMAGSVAIKLTAHFSSFGFVFASTLKVCRGLACRRKKSRGKWETAHHRNWFFAKPIKIFLLLFGQRQHLLSLLRPRQVASNSCFGKAWGRVVVPVPQWPSQDLPNFQALM